MGRDPVGGTAPTDSAPLGRASSAQCKAGAQRAFHPRAHALTKRRAPAPVSSPPPLQGQGHSRPMEWRVVMCLSNEVICVTRSGGPRFLQCQRLLSALEIRQQVHPSASLRDAVPARSR